MRVSNESTSPSKKAISVIDRLKLKRNDTRLEYETKDYIERNNFFCTIELDVPTIKASKTAARSIRMPQLRCFLYRRPQTD